MSDSPVQYSFEDGVARIDLDDGKANAFSHLLIDAVDACLDRALTDKAGAVVMVGRPGKFSAGFDLKAMMDSAAARRALVERGAQLMLRVYDFPRPIVLAVTGHALAAGAVLLTAADIRIAADVDAKIGLNEVAIGMSLPIFAMELARARLSKRHLLDATCHARIYSPKSAVDAGYIDEVVAPDALVETAMERARALAALADPGYRATKRLLRGPTLTLIRETLVADMDKIGEAG
ncbi:MAG: enoyl-CoA hydratase [Hyphomicrobiaceae bacterium]